MSLFANHPHFAPRPGLSRPATYGEPVIADAARRAGDQITALIAAIDDNNLAGAIMCAENVGVWLGEVRRMRSQNEDAHVKALRQSRLRGEITDSELEGELIALAVDTNRITQD